MIRERLIKNGVGIHDSFRWRSHEISRIEGLSDAVFAFAVTLLIVSLEVPKTFAELLKTMQGFIAFAISFFLLIQVWFHQYKFFRRYGLQDTFTIWLNVVLIFVVLFFVYPLKFLFTLIINQLMGIGTDVRLPDGTIEHVIEVSQVPTLMIVYGLGFAAVFCVFALLNHHAYRKRVELELTELEVFDTRSSIQQSVLDIGIALISVTIALIVAPSRAGLAGFAYFLAAPALTIHGYVRGSSRRKLEERIETSTPIQKIE